MVFRNRYNSSWLNAISQEGGTKQLNTLAVHEIFLVIPYSTCGELSMKTTLTCTEHSSFIARAAPTLLVCKPETILPATRSLHTDQKNVATLTEDNCQPVGT